MYYYCILEIKPRVLGSRIRDVEAFWYKTEIKIIHFVPLCLIVLIVSDCMVYLDPKFLIFKKSKVRFKTNFDIRRPVQMTWTGHNFIFLSFQHSQEGLWTASTNFGSSMRIGAVKTDKDLNTLLTAKIMPQR